MPKTGRKANFSVTEIRLLVEKFREQRNHLNNSDRRNENLRADSWRQIYECYCEAFPEFSAHRSYDDIKRKLIKLRSEALQLYTRERMKENGEDIRTLSMKAQTLTLSTAHQLMINALKDIAEKETDSDFVEYEVEIDGDAVNDHEEDGEEIEAQKIIKQLFFPDPSPANATASDEEDAPLGPPQKKRMTKRPSRRTKVQGILDLQREKLEIERDNLLLVQKKLELEVKLLERQLEEPAPGATSNSIQSDGPGRKLQYRRIIRTRVEPSVQAQAAPVRLKDTTALVELD